MLDFTRLLVLLTLALELTNALGVEWTSIPPADDGDGGCRNDVNPNKRALFSQQVSSSVCGFLEQLIFWVEVMWENTHSHTQIHARTPLCRITKNTRLLIVWNVFISLIFYLIPPHGTLAISITLRVTQCSVARWENTGTWRGERVKSTARTQPGNKLLRCELASCGTQPAPACGSAKENTLASFGLIDIGLWPDIKHCGLENRIQNSKIFYFTRVHWERKSYSIQEDWQAGLNCWWAATGEKDTPLEAGNIQL